MSKHLVPPTENYQQYVPESAQVGKPVVKIKAMDEDLGVNADIKYSIINSEGANMFSISTDRDTREGIISLKKVPSFRTTDTKQSYSWETFVCDGGNFTVEPPGKRLNGTGLPVRLAPSEERRVNRLYVTMGVYFRCKAHADLVTLN